MRIAMMASLLWLAGCATPGTPQADLSTASAPHEVSATRTGGAFAGEWEACQGTTAPEECSRYVLWQRGDRLCGTWAYFASGKSYDGRLIARVTSPTEARRTHICGRPGSDTDTECEDGWQRVDKPLRICDGKLGHTRADGSCFADYQRVPIADEVRDALQAQPWMLACLSSDP